MPCRTHCSLSAISRARQHVRWCLFHFKHSLMPRFFFCAFYEKVSLFFPMTPHCTAYSVLQPTMFLYCVLQTSAIQWSHYCKNYCSSHVYIIPPSFFWHISLADINQPALLYWLVKAKKLGTGACFSSKYSSDWSYAWRHDDNVAIQDKRQEYKSDTNNHD